jgi:hypothetical protein
MYKQGFFRGNAWILMYLRLVFKEETVLKTTDQRGGLSRVPLSFMGWLTAGSLVGIGIGFWLLMTMIGVTVVAIAIIAVVSIVMAGLVFTGLRWEHCLVLGCGSAGCRRSNIRSTI